ncbi:MAG: spore coat protein CotH [Myxococcota bacterium]|jgi:spore coat protein CotH
MIFLLLSCAPVSIVDTVTPSISEEEQQEDTPDTPDVIDTGDDDIDVVVGDGGGGEAWIYDPTVLHTLELTLDDESVSTLQSQTEAYSAEIVYVSADMVYDGESLGEVGLRIKGRWGSWRSLSQKSSFKLDFNRYVDGQKFHGLKSMTLNNMVIDCSYMREHIAYQVYRAGGSPAPRTAYTRISVNGTDYGLYLNVESVDDVFLDRHFDDSSGNMYDADYILWDDGSYTVLDFYPNLVKYFDQEEGKEGDRSDLMTLSQLLDQVEGSPDAYEDTAEAVDWPAHRRLMANELWTGQIDGYSLNRNNYLAYFHKGQVVVLPWDHDYAFIEPGDWGFSWAYPQGRLSSLCINDDECRDELMVDLQAVLDVVDLLDVPNIIDDTADWLADEIRTDPRRECSDGYITYYQDVLRGWAATRSSDLERQWGL